MFSPKCLRILISVKPGTVQSGSNSLGIRSNVLNLYGRVTFALPCIVEHLRRSSPFMLAFVEQILQNVAQKTVTRFFFNIRFMRGLLRVKLKIYIHLAFVKTKAYSEFGVRLYRHKKTLKFCVVFQDVSRCIFFCYS